MKLEQIYTGCIAHAAYYLESNGEVAIFDPLREPEPYIQKATQSGANIKYIFETHFHADFVSGHLDLAQRSGATIVYGPTAKPQFDAVIAEDGERFSLGDIQIEAIHTPGHTMESTCYLVYDEDGKPKALISGDTLFIGDVGRPDLAQHVVSSLTPELLAGHLYESIHHKLMPLPDDIIVYPNHGAGSACGKNLSTQTSDTLGNQKRTNYALDPALSKEAFIKVLMDGQRIPPAYFPENVLLNIRGYESLDTVMSRSLKALKTNQFQAVWESSGALVLDTRKASEFAKGAVKGSVNIGIDGQFAMWVGALIPGTQHPILLVTDEGRETETITRLSRIGYDHVLGYLEGGFQQWKLDGLPIDTFQRISALTLESSFDLIPMIIDVRNESEYAAKHIEGALNIPLDYLNRELHRIPKDMPVVLHCAGGYRSMVALSMLKSKGWELVQDVEGGMTAIETTKVPQTAFQCQSTQKVESKA